MVVERYLAISIVKGIWLANIMEHRCPAQDEVGAVGFLVNRLAQHRQRMRVDIFMLGVFIGHLPQRANFRDNMLA